MTQTERSPRASDQRPSLLFRLGAAVLLAAAMLVGILLLGRLATSDVMAIAITSGFFVLLAGGLALVVRRQRALLVPLGVTYAVIAAGARVVLGLPLITDEVVDEDVVEVTAAAPPSGGGAAESGVPSALATGTFEARVHPGEGTATLVNTGDGSTVLTLRDFATDNGPDLFVYLVPPTAPENSVEGFVNLGSLKGNVGDQQYVLPADVDAGPGWRVVIWCRAFEVDFTEASLA
jgi:hypothetical protein